MNPILKDVFDKSVAHYRGDARVLGAWVYGSVNHESQDQYSDVDPMFLIRDEAFEAIDREMPDLFKGWCGRIDLWWPEGFNGDKVRNYTILFPGEGDRLLQYDVNFMKSSALDEEFGRSFLSRCRPEQILFDPTGRLGEVLRTAPRTPPGSDRLAWFIEKYWLYAFISTKYFARSDIFKLIYACNEMFGTHMEILLRRYGKPSTGWWATNIKQFPKDVQGELKIYFGPPELGSIREGFFRQMDLFARDARAACERHGIAYPAAVEQRIRRHIGATVG